MDADVVYEPRVAAAHGPPPGRPRRRRRHRLHQGGEPARQRTSTASSPSSTSPPRRRPGGPRTCIGASPAWPAGRSSTAGPTSRRSAAGSTPRPWPRTPSPPSRPSWPGAGWCSSRTPWSGPRSRATSTGCGSSGCGGHAATSRSPGATSTCGSGRRRATGSGRPPSPCSGSPRSLLPLFMITRRRRSSASGSSTATSRPRRSRPLWIVNGLGFVFVVTFTLLIDPSTARRTWREAVLFPGVVSLFVILHACFPAAFRPLAGGRATDRHPLGDLGGDLFLLGRLPLGVAVHGGGVARQAARPGRARRLGRRARVRRRLRAAAVRRHVHGLRPEARGAEQAWDKTVKTGKVAVRT